MANGTRFPASICITDLVNAANAQHSSMNVSAKNGKLYANVTVWLNDQPDDKGNVMSFQLNSTQAGEQSDLQKFNGKKVYIGNAKPPTAPKQTPPTPGSVQVNMGAYGQVQGQAAQQQGFYQQPQQAQQWGQMPQPQQAQQGGNPWQQNQPQHNQTLPF